MILMILLRVEFMGLFKNVFKSKMKKGARRLGKEWDEEFNVLVRKLKAVRARDSYAVFFSSTHFHLSRIGV